MLPFSVFSTQLVDPHDCRKQLKGNFLPANVKIKTSKGHKTLNLKNNNNKDGIMFLVLAFNSYLADYSLELSVV